MAPSQSASEIIRLLDLQPHPGEGGYFRETFRDTQTSNGRSVSTMIYFLMTSDNPSQLHRIDGCESWHFYAGDAVNVVELADQGARVTRLGMDLKSGERPQYVVQGNTWFGSALAKGGDWALVGCVVAPAFEFEKFELGERANLLDLFPSCAEWIEELTAVSN